MKFNLKTKRDEKSNLQAAAEEDEEDEVSVSASSQSVSQTKPEISGWSEVLQKTGGLTGASSSSLFWCQKRHNAESTNTIVMMYDV